MMNKKSSSAANSFRKLRLVACLQIILQGLTPISLAMAPAFAANASKEPTSFSPMALTPHQRAIIEGEYISRNHFKTGHILATGESLEQVAKDSYISLLTLREVNRIKYPDDNAFYHLQAGDIVMIPQWQSPEEAAHVLQACYSPANIALAEMSATEIAAAATPVKARHMEHSAAEGSGTDTEIAQWLNQAGTIASGENRSDAVKNMAISSASGYAASGIENWLNQYGHARVQLNVNDKMHLDGSSADLLLPLDDRNNVLTFTQFGIHDKDDYTTANVGLGQRYFSNDAMYGYNAFIDQELRNNHTRLGLGVEYWRDYFRLAGNGYFGLTGWKESKNLQDYEEKAASGFDIRSQAYLPSMPQIGGKLAFEQYFGDEVGLFGKDNRQKDPFAVTAGINYTPVPLITAGVDYKQGKAGENEAQFNLQFNYLFGVPWAEQISPESVKQLRTLAGSKLEFVDRNNNMVMQYRKMEMIKLSLPATVRGSTKTQQMLVATVEARHGLDHIQWNDSALIAAGGSIKQINNLQYEITLPTKGGEFSLSAVAYDPRGNASNTASTQVVVVDNGTVQNPIKINSLVADKPTAAADGSDTVTYTLRALDTSGQQTDFTGYKVHWKNDGVGDMAETETGLKADGSAEIKLTSTTPGKVDLSATLLDSAGNQIAQTKNDQVTFISVTSGYQLTGLKADPATAPADGKTAIEWSVTATNNGKALAGYTVKWIKDSTEPAGDLPADSDKTKTNEKGMASVNVTSSSAGKVTLHAELVDSNGNTVVTSEGVTAEFYAKAAPAPDSSDDIILTADPKQVQWVDGSVTLNADVKDSNDNPLATTEMKWNVDNCTECVLPDKPTTDANGKISTTLSLKSDAQEGERYLKLCTTDGAVCSSEMKVTFVALPKITHYRTLGGQDREGVIFNEPRIRDGEIQLTADKSQYEGQLVTYTWDSDDTAKISIDQTGKITLLSDSGNNVELTGHISGLPDKAAKFKIANTSEWYEYDDTPMLYESKEGLCSRSSGTLSEPSDADALHSVWGNFDTYSKLKRTTTVNTPFNATWLGGTKNSIGNAADAYILGGDKHGTTLKNQSLTNTLKYYGLCKYTPKSSN